MVWSCCFVLEVVFLVWGGQCTVWKCDCCCTSVFSLWIKLFSSSFLLQSTVNLFTDFHLFIYLSLSFLLNEKLTFLIFIVLIVIGFINIIIREKKIIDKNISSFFETALRSQLRKISISFMGPSYLESVLLLFTVFYWPSYSGMRGYLWKVQRYGLRRTCCWLQHVDLHLCNYFWCVYSFFTIAIEHSSIRFELRVLSRFLYFSWRALLGSDKPFSIAVVLMGGTFCAINGWLNAHYMITFK